MRSEAKARKEIIDQRLLEASWKVDDRTQVVQELVIDKENELDLLREPDDPYGKFEYSDYALLGNDGRTLAVVGSQEDLQRC